MQMYKILYINHAYHAYKSISLTNGIRQEGVSLSGALKHKSRTISHLLMESVAWHIVGKYGRKGKTDKK